MGAESIDQLVEDAIQILSDLGIPTDGLKKRRKTRMAKTFLALCDMKKDTSWSEAKSILEGHAFLSRDIIRYMNEYLDEKISDSSYDDIRRKDLLYPVEAGIVLKSAKNIDASTNDGTRKYAVSKDVIPVVRAFKSDNYKNELSAYLSCHVSLRDRLNTERERRLLPVALPTGEEIKFSTGEHNSIQKKVIEIFLPYFGYDAEVFYVGDSSDKFLYLKKERLQEIGFFEISHGKLPDIIAYSKNKNWLYLIEAVHTSNPITEMRKLVLDDLTKNVSIPIVYVTAFNDRANFKKFAHDIAWETEVWIADNPTHLIHYNGDKFLGPHSN